MIKKILCIILGIICGVNMTGLIARFNIGESITITYNGNEYNYTKNSDEYKSIYNGIMEYVKDAHEMPALGVSLDHETKTEKQNGLWLEIHFAKTMQYLDMPFDSLLIKIEKDNSGCNIIRGNNGKYEGRCYYLNTTGTMENLYNTVLNTIEK